MPIASRMRLTAAADVMGALRAHVGHRDANTAAALTAFGKCLESGIFLRRSRSSPPCLLG